MLFFQAVALGCYSQRDCKEGYCCTGGITPWLKGVCRKLGEEGKTLSSELFPYLCRNHSPLRISFLDFQSFLLMIVQSVLRKNAEL